MEPCTSSGPKSEDHLQRITCDWDLNRRHGFRYALQPPEAAIDPSEDAVSIDSTYAMRSSFAADQDNGALTLLDALVEVLTGSSTNKH